MPYLQNKQNSSIKLLTEILAFIKRCLFIYKQMQAIDRIKNRIMSQAI